MSLYFGYTLTEAAIAQMQAARGTRVTADVVPVATMTRAPEGQVSIDRGLDAAAQAELDRLLAQQQQAELEAAGATSYSDTMDQPQSLFERFGPWLWVGAAAGAIGLIVIGVKVTKRKPPVAGYRRRSRR